MHKEEFFSEGVAHTVKEKIIWEQMMMRSKAVQRLLWSYSLTTWLLLF